MSPIAVLPMYGALAAGITGLNLAGQPNKLERAAGVGLLAIASALGYVAWGI